MGRKISTAEDDEGEDVLVTRIEPATAPGLDVARADRFDQPEHDATDHRAGQVADTAEHRCREGLKPRHEAHRVVRDAVVRRDHHASHCSQCRPNDEGQRDDAVRIHAHQARNAVVLGRRAHRAAHVGARHQQDKANHHRGRQPDGGHLHWRHEHTADDLDRRGLDELREAVIVAAPDDHRERLQQEGNANRGNQRRQPRRVAQASICGAFDRVADRHAGRHRHHQTQREVDDRAKAGNRGLKECDRSESDEGADHQHVAMGEVDQAENAIHHRVAQRDDCVHAADHEAVDDLLKQGLNHGRNPRGKTFGPAREGAAHRSAQAPRSVAGSSRVVRTVGCAPQADQFFSAFQAPFSN